MNITSVNSAASGLTTTPEHAALQDAQTATAAKVGASAQKADVSQADMQAALRLSQQSSSIQLPAPSLQNAEETSETQTAVADLGKTISTDIFALLALFKDLAEQLSKSSTETQRAQTTKQVNLELDAAAKMDKAAITQLVASIITSAVSAIAGALTAALDSKHHGKIEIGKTIGTLLPNLVGGLVAAKQIKAQMSDSATAQEQEQLRAQLNRVTAEAKKALKDVGEKLVDIMQSRQKANSGLASQV